MFGPLGASLNFREVFMEGLYFFLLFFPKCWGEKVTLRILDCFPGRGKAECLGEGLTEGEGMLMDSKALLGNLGATAIREISVGAAEAAAWAGIWRWRL